jgi:siroheme synthase (precorrin-2 oxidase/ferrochelatase)
MLVVLRTRVHQGCRRHQLLINLIDNNLFVSDLETPHQQSNPMLVIILGSMKL